MTSYVVLKSTMIYLCSVKHPADYCSTATSPMPLSLIMDWFGFADAIREMKKYSGDAKTDDTAHGHLDVEIQHHMRLFRAQRNFYISGFALFLFL